MKIINIVLFSILSIAVSSASDNIICSPTGSACQLIDASGNHWNAKIGFTTDGNGDIFTLGDVASTDNIIGQNPSGNRTLIDNSSRRWSASVVYTTDGNGNVIPVPSGGGGGAAWGSITGTLSDQTDLQSVLDGKQSVGDYLTALTGDVTATGPGSASATVNSVGGSAASDIGSATISALLGGWHHLHVEPSYGGSPASDGSVLRPYTTLTSALNKIISNNDGGNYVIDVGPGTLTENISFNNAAFTRLAILGAQVRDGALSNESIPIVSLVGNVTSTSNNTNLKGFIMSGIDVVGNINFTGDIAGTNLCEYACMFADIVPITQGSPITFNNVGDVVFRDIGSGTSDGVSIQNVNSFLNYHSFMNFGAISIVTNSGANKPNGFSSTSAQMSYGSVVNTISVDSGSALTMRGQRATGVITNNGSLTTVNSVFGADVTGSGTWSSTGDANTVLPTLAPTGGGKAYRFDRGYFLNGASPATSVSLAMKNGHYKSTQTTAPAATPNANAGTSATCTVANATDSFGTINLTTTATSPNSGDQCDVAFNLAYGVSPVCVFSPSNANAAQLSVSSGVYSTSSTSAFSVNFAATDAIGHAYSWNYHCFETQ